jgi:hypothetical protein
MNDGTLRDRSQEIIDGYNSLVGDQITELQQFGEERLKPIVLSTLKVLWLRQREV